MTCADCEESPYCCIGCGKGTCPVHRWGMNGSPDCLCGKCTTVAARAAKDRWAKFDEKRPALLDRYGLVNVLAPAFIVAWLIVGLLHFLFG